MLPGNGFDFWPDRVWVQLAILFYQAKDRELESVRGLLRVSEGY